MTNRAAKFLSSAALVATPFALWAQSARLEHVPDGQVSASLLIWGLLPYSHVYLAPHIDTGQVAKLVAPGAPDLMLAAVEYADQSDIQPGIRPMSQCGIYFLPQGKPQRFVATVGPDYPASCDGTSAIALMTDSGPRPRLIVLCQTLSAHGDNAVIPFILSWSAKKDGYQLDRPASEWLLDQAVFLDTITKVRHYLTLYDKSKLQHGPPIKPGLKTERSADAGSP